MKHSYEKADHQNKPICAYEFHEKGGCHWKSECRFGHNISETERNDQELKDIMKAKLGQLLQWKKPNRRDDDQMNGRNPGKPSVRTTHHNGPPATSRITENTEDTVVIPRAELQKMYDMLQQSQPQNYF